MLAFDDFAADFAQALLADDEAAGFELQLLPLVVGRFPNLAPDLAEFQAIDAPSASRMRSNLLR